MAKKASRRKPKETKTTTTPEPKPDETLDAPVIDALAPSEPAEDDAAGEAPGEPAGSEGEQSGPGFPHDYEPADWFPIQCPRCGSTDREPFKGRTRRVGPYGRRYHHMLKRWYTTVIFRPTRCKKCGQRIMSREFVDETPPEDRVGDSDTAS